MAFEELLRRRAVLRISEPWDFAGETGCSTFWGELVAVRPVVPSSAKLELVIRFDVPFTRSGEVCDGAAVVARYVGHSPATLIEDNDLTCNGRLMEIADGDPTLVPARPYEFPFAIIGSIELPNADPSGLCAQAGG